VWDGPNAYGFSHAVLALADGAISPLFAAAERAFLRG
jgi:hypothetical protein